MKCFLSTNVKDEHNIQEWLEYHLLLGFDHILIWDDFSQVPIYCPNERVSIIRQHYKKVDYITESVAFAKRRGMDWIMHLDADEYLYVGKDTKLKDFLKRHVHHDTMSIYFPWVLFGSSHLNVLKTRGSCLEPFLQCDTKTHKYIKQLARTNMIIGVRSPHEFVYSQKQTPENTVYAPSKRLFNYNPVQTREIQTVSPNRCFIAHYRFQSWDLFKERKGRQRDDTQQNWKFPFPLGDTPPAFFHGTSNQTYFPHVFQNYQNWLSTSR